MRIPLLVGACAGALTLAAAASAQTLADQKTEAEIAKLQVETAKARVDTEKARIEADNALFSVIRGTSGGSADVAAGEKTAEGLLLSRASLAGASAMVVGSLPAAGYPAAADTRPVVIWGGSPASVAQWLVFREERARIAKQLKAANAAWAATKSTKMAFVPAAAGVATLVATVIPLFKTDTKLAGGAVGFDESDARASMAAALQQARYGTLTTLAVTDGVALADDLLAPLASDLEQARAAYEDEFVAFYENRMPEGNRSEKIKAAAVRLKSALDAHKGLRDQLLAETGGIVAAGVVDRQRQLHANPSKHPVIHLLNVDAAYTSTTKKGLLTGLGGRVPAFGSVSTVIDYAIVGPDREIRGTVACTIGNRPTKGLLALDPSTYAAAGAALCGTPPG